MGMQAGPPPSGGRSGLQGRVPQRSATVTPEEEEPASGRLHVPTVRGGVHTRPPPPAAGLAAGKAEPQEHPRSTPEAQHGRGPSRQPGSPQNPSSTLPQGYTSDGMQPPGSPTWPGASGTLLRRPGPRTQTGCAVGGQDDTGCREQSRGTPAPGVAAPWRAPQRLPCRYARGGGTPLNPQRALV